jgi:hypothetical protein
MVSRVWWLAFAFAVASALPDGWNAATDAQGRQYYYNIVSRASQWDVPKAPIPELQKLVAGAPGAPQSPPVEQDVAVASLLKAAAATASSPSSDAASAPPVPPTPPTREQAQWTRRMVTTFSAVRKLLKKVSEINSDDDEEGEHTRESLPSFAVLLHTLRRVSAAFHSSDHSGRGDAALLLRMRDDIRAVRKEAGPQAAVLLQSAEIELEAALVTGAGSRRTIEPLPRDKAAAADVESQPNTGDSQITKEDVLAVLALLEKDGARDAPPLSAAALEAVQGMTIEFGEPTLHRLSKDDVQKYAEAGGGAPAEPPGHLPHVDDDPDALDQLVVVDEVLVVDGTAKTLAEVKADNAAQARARKAAAAAVAAAAEKAEPPSPTGTITIEGDVTGIEGVARDDYSLEPLRRCLEGYAPAMAVALVHQASSDSRAAAQKQHVRIDGDVSIGPDVIFRGDLSLEDPDLGQQQQKEHQQAVHKVTEIEAERDALLAELMEEVRARSGPKREDLVARFEKLRLLGEQTPMFAAAMRKLPKSGREAAAAAAKAMRVASQKATQAEAAELPAAHDNWLGHKVDHELEQATAATPSALVWQQQQQQLSDGVPPRERGLLSDAARNAADDAAKARGETGPPDPPPWRFTHLIMRQLTAADEGSVVARIVKAAELSPELGTVVGLYRMKHRARQTRVAVEALVWNQVKVEKIAQDCGEPHLRSLLMLLLARLCKITGDLEQGALVAEELSVLAPHSAELLFVLGQYQLELHGRNTRTLREWELAEDTRDMTLSIYFDPAYDEAKSFRSANRTQDPLNPTMIRTGGVSWLQWRKHHRKKFITREAVSKEAGTWDNFTDSSSGSDGTGDAVSERELYLADKAALARWAHRNATRGCLALLQAYRTDPHGTQPSELFLGRMHAGPRALRALVRMQEQRLHEMKRALKEGDELRAVWLLHAALQMSATLGNVEITESVLTLAQEHHHKCGGRTALLLYQELVRFFGEGAYTPFPNWMSATDIEMWESMQGNAEHNQRLFDVAWLMTQECSPNPFTKLTKEGQDACKDGVIEAYAKQMARRGITFSVPRDAVQFDQQYAAILKNAVTMGTLQRQPKMRAVMVHAAAHAGIARLAAYAPPADARRKTDGSHRVIRHAVAAITLYRHILKGDGRRKKDMWGGKPFHAEPHCFTCRINSARMQMLLKHYVPAQRHLWEAHVSLAGRGSVRDFYMMDPEQPPLIGESDTPKLQQAIGSLISLPKMLRLTVGSESHTVGVMHRIDIIFQLIRNFRLSRLKLKHDIHQVKYLLDTGTISKALAHCLMRVYRAAIHVESFMGNKTATSKEDNPRGLRSDDREMVPLRTLNSEVMRLVSLSLDTGLSMAATAEDFQAPRSDAKKKELESILRVQTNPNHKPYYMLRVHPMDRDVPNGVDEFNKYIIDLSQAKITLPAPQAEDFVLAENRFDKVGFMAFEGLLANKTLVRWRERGHLVSAWQDRAALPGILATSLEKGFVAADMGYAAAAFLKVFPRLFAGLTLTDVWAYK